MAKPKNVKKEILCGCGCGRAATANYGGVNVCAETYRSMARDDDRPHEVPANHDWAREMATRPPK